MSDRRKEATPTSTSQPAVARRGPREVIGWLREWPPVAIVAATLLFWLAFVVVDARGRWSGDVRGFLCLGAVVEHPAALTGAPSAGPYGYDGQYYAALAFDPLLRRPGTLDLIDTPSYRATRILVPLLAWLLALGIPAAIPYVYLLLCWGAGFAAVWLVARWLEEERANPWWALWLGCSGGVAAALIRATPDTAALLMILVALLLHRRRRLGLAIGTLCLAVLARETSVIAVGAIALVELLARRFRLAAFVTVIPAIPALAWQLYLRHMLGSAFNTGASNLGIPFTWIPAKLHQVFGGHSVWWMEVWGLAAITAGFIAFAVVLARPRSWDAVDATFAGFLLLALFLTFNVCVEGWAYGRVLAVVPFLAVLIAAREATAFRRWALRAVVICYALLGLLMMRGELRGALLGRSVLRAVRQGALYHRPIQPLRPPQPPATVTPAPASTPAPRFVLYVMPVAHATGVAGSEWRTDMEVTNLANVPNTVTAELLLAEQPNERPEARTGVLAPHETRVFPDMLDSVFSRTGLAALRLTAGQGPIAATCRTYDSSRPRAPSATLAALPAQAAVGFGGTARLTGLVDRDGAGAGTRTNLAVLNLEGRPIDVEVELLDGHDRRVSHLAGSLRPFELKQVTDLFAVAGVPSSAIVTAQIRTTTPGGEFLAVATIVQRDSSRATFVLPR